MPRTSNGSSNTYLNTTVSGFPWPQNYRLGMGVDAITGQLRAPAVAPFTVQDRPAIDQKYDKKVITSQSDLESLISGSINGSYNLEGIELSASASYLESISVSDLSVTLVAYLNTLESEFALAPSYRLAVSPTTPDFRKKFGDYFVAGYLRGSSLYVIYECHFEDVEKRSQFAAAIKADCPPVFTVEGSIAFEKMLRESQATTSIRIAPTGVSSPIPTPPGGDWTPENILNALIPWYNGAISMVPLKAYLQHYALIDPSVMPTVPIDPDIFDQLGHLYDRFWLARSRFNGCPAFGKRLVQQAFIDLTKDLEAFQAVLPEQPERIAALTARTQRLLTDLQDIDHRQNFCSQVIRAATTEPAQGANVNANDGRVVWPYGFTVGGEGVEITRLDERVSADWKIGWNEHTFVYRDASKIVVGWTLTCNRNDGHNGDWHKACDQVLGRGGGDVYVKGDYDRGYDWTITWYVVDAHLYPTGPWRAAALHAPEWSSDLQAEDHGWTIERMRAATPEDRLEVGEAASPQVVPQVTSASPGPGVPVAEFGEDVGPITSLVQQPQVYPQRTVGRLFYTKDGKDCWASGVVVAQGGIMTAAHCLLQNHKMASDIVFVPAFNDGVGNYGVWRLKQWWWPNAWAQQNDTAWDVAFAHTYPQAGTGLELGDVTGWVGLTWGTVADSWIEAGYPSQPIPGYPFDGQRMWKCLGSRMPSDTPSVIAMHSNLTAGGSGGPWFVQTPPSDRPLVNGLFSRFNVDLQRNQSPEFAPWVGAFYHHIFP